MKRDDFITEVIFRKEKDGDITAYFPYDVDYKGFCTCYAHVGQHSTADYNYCMQKEKPAREIEYAELKSELESLGYNLKVINRRNNRRYIKAIREIRNSY